MNEILKKFRQSKNLTQKEFADKLGVSRATIAQIEVGNNNLSADVSSKIKKIFDVDIENIQINNITFDQVNSNNMENDNSSAKRWKNKSVLGKNHFVIKIIDTYKKDIEFIEYFNNKINLSLSILRNLGSEPDDNFNKLKTVLDKNLTELKEIYSYFLIGSLTREELISNKDFFENRHTGKLNNILSSESTIQWEQTSDELILHSKNLLELFKNCFDEIFELINKYSQIK